MFIENPTEDVLRRSIETVPITPVHGKIRLFYQGIQLPTQKSEDRLRYLDECENFGILPFSELTLIGGNYPSVSVRGNNSLLSILNGGRMYGLSCDDGDRSYTSENFDKFRNEFLPSVLQEGYKLQEIDLWLTIRRGSGYDWLNHSGVTLSYDRNKKGGTNLLLTNLNFGPRTSEVEDKLTYWFEELKKEVLVT